MTATHAKSRGEARAKANQKILKRNGGITAVTAGGGEAVAGRAERSPTQK